jgi:hypothetical protein
MGPIACQCLSNIGLRNAELSGDLRWFDTGFEGSAYGVQLPGRQSHDSRLDPLLA